MAWGSRHTPALARGVVVAVVGIIVGVLTGLPVGWMWGWTAAAVVFTVWTWAALWSMDPAQTLERAGVEEPGRAIVDGVLLLASVASIGGLGALLVSSHAGQAA